MSIYKHTKSFIERILMNRRTFLKRGLGSVLTFFGVSSGGYYYAKELEPRMIKIQKEIIKRIVLKNQLPGILKHCCPIKDTRPLRYKT